MRQESFLSGLKPHGHITMNKAVFSGSLIVLLVCLPPDRLPALRRESQALMKRTERSLHRRIRMKSFLFTICAAIWAAGTTCHADEATAAVVYVAVNGDDGNSGTKERPFATLEAARDAARKSDAEPHRIVVMPGDYLLANTLELDMRDSGLTIEAEPAGKATLYGGKLVTGWQRDGDHFWCADLPGVKEGTWDFRALIVNGRLAERACFPGTDAFENLGTWNLPLLPAVAGHWERKPTREELTTMPYDPQDIPATLDVRNAEVRLYHMWAESLVGVASNDTDRHALILSSEPAWPPGALNRRKYVILNTREGMTRPGQWYLDRTAGRVVYWPLLDEDLAEIKVIAPTTERILRISGSSQQNAESITIRGLTLQATTAPLKPASFGAGAFDGALSVAHARQCVLEDLEICNVGGLAIRADNLTGCRIAGMPCPPRRSLRRQAQ